MFPRKGFLLEDGELARRGKDIADLASVHLVANKLGHVRHQVAHVDILTVAVDAARAVCLQHVEEVLPDTAP